MKFVIQRVKSASVTVEGEIVGKIDRGILVLLGFTSTDNKSSIEFAANKLLSIRLWEDNKGRNWASSVKDNDYGILVVSQFTLYSFFKGNKPDFHKAMNPTEAIVLYDLFMETLKKKHSKVAAGKFGAMMDVSLVNDGPVTMNWEYPEEDSNKSSSSVTSSMISSLNKSKVTSDIKNSNKINNKESGYFKNKEENKLNDKDNEVDQTDKIDIDIDKEIKISNNSSKNDVIDNNNNKI